MKGWNAIFALAVLMLAGCSGIKPYPNDLEKNLYLMVKVKSDSMFSSVKASVDIYRVDLNCQTYYQGTVNLNNETAKVGIPASRPSYLVFNFSSSSFLANSSGSINYETVLIPRAGHIYDAEVNYVDDLYNVTTFERGKRGRHEIEDKSLKDCIPNN